MPNFSFVDSELANDCDLPFQRALLRSDGPEARHAVILQYVDIRPSKPRSADVFLPDFAGAWLYAPKHRVSSPRAPADLRKSNSQILAESAHLAHLVRLHASLSGFTLPRIDVLLPTATGD